MSGARTIASLHETFTPEQSRTALLCAGRDRSDDAELDPHSRLYREVMASRGITPALEAVGNFNFVSGFICGSLSVFAAVVTWLAVSA